MDQTILNQGHFQIGEQSYSIIGMGWVIPWSFAAANPHYQPWMYLARLMGKKQDFISYHFQISGRISTKTGSGSVLLCVI